jgi:hypothetical protein
VRGDGSARDRHQCKYASIFRGHRDVALSKSLANGIELGGILDGEIGRPTRVILDQFDRDFYSIAPLMVLRVIRFSVS